MSDLFTQQSTMPELFKTGDDIAEELKAQTVEQTQQQIYY